MKSLGNRGSTSELMTLSACAVHWLMLAMCAAGRSRRQQPGGGSAGCGRHGHAYGGGRRVLSQWVGGRLPVGSRMTLLDQASHVLVLSFARGATCVVYSAQGSTLSACITRIDLAYRHKLVWRLRRTSPHSVGCSFGCVRSIVQTCYWHVLRLLQVLCS